MSPEYKTSSGEIDMNQNILQVATTDRPVHIGLQNLFYFIFILTFNLKTVFFLHPFLSPLILETRVFVFFSIFSPFSAFSAPSLRFSHSLLHALACSHIARIWA